MKYLICSDIHGSMRAAEAILASFNKLQCDKILLLGDVLYHGPRNPLADSHDPKSVIEILNSAAQHIIACRGNCDAEVDQMMLKFPLMSDYILLSEGGRRVFATHGHLWSPEKLSSVHGRLPDLSAGDIFLYGHIHIPQIEVNKDGVIICNAGSPSLPKGNSEASFAVYDSGNGVLTLNHLDGGEYKKLEIKALKT